MGIETILKIAAIGIITAVINQVLKQSGKEEFAVVTSLAGLVIVLLMVIDLVSNLFSAVKGLLGI